MKRSIAIVLLMLAIIGCEQSTTEPVVDQEPQRTLIGSATEGDLTVQLYADRIFRVGYNAVYIKVRRGGVAATNVKVTLNPVMDMGMLTHSTPVEQPDEATDAFSNHCGAILFIMAGSSSQWSVNLSVIDTNGGDTTDVHIPVDVSSSSNVKVLKSGANRTVVTLIEDTWQVGMNDVRIMLHASIDGFTFTPINDAELQIDPTMPSMGHGSSGNIDPVFADEGLYMGKMNLIMTGDWDLEVKQVNSSSDPFTVNFPIHVP